MLQSVIINQTWNLVSGTMLMLCWISLTPSPLERRRKLTLSKKTQSPKWLGILAWSLGPVAKISLETFCQTKFKICRFYVKNNTRLKYSNTTLFLLNKCLLKCVQHRIDVFPTENLSIQNSLYLAVSISTDVFGLRLKTKVDFWGLTHLFPMYPFSTSWKH